MAAIRVRVPHGDKHSREHAHNDDVRDSRAMPPSRSPDQTGPVAMELVQSPLKNLPAGPHVFPFPSLLHIPMAGHSTNTSIQQPTSARSGINTKNQEAFLGLTLSPSAMLAGNSIIQKHPVHALHFIGERLPVCHQAIADHGSSHQAPLEHSYDFVDQRTSSSGGGNSAAARQLSSGSTLSPPCRGIWTSESQGQSSFAPILLNHGRDIPHYKSLLVVEGPETSDAGFMMHNIIRGAHSFWQ
ncbi:unnamed protein product [Boreogadus saida]